jgi:hypothetical protein
VVLLRQSAFFSKGAMPFLVSRIGDYSFRKVRQALQMNSSNIIIILPIEKAITLIISIICSLSSLCSL